MGKNTYKSISDTAEYFGLSQSTIRNWINDGRLPPHCYFKAGGVYRIAIERAERNLMAAVPEDEIDVGAGEPEEPDEEEEGKILHVDMLPVDMSEIEEVLTDGDFLDEDDDETEGDL